MDYCFKVRDGQVARKGLIGDAWEIDIVLSPAEIVLTRDNEAKETLSSLPEVIGDYQLRDGTVLCVKALSEEESAIDAMIRGGKSVGVDVEPLQVGETFALRLTWQDGEVTALMYPTEKEASAFADFLLADDCESGILEPHIS